MASEKNDAMTIKLIRWKLSCSSFHPPDLIVDVGVVAGSVVVVVVVDVALSSRCRLRFAVASTEQQCARKAGGGEESRLLRAWGKAATLPYIYLEAGLNQTRRLRAASPSVPCARAS